MYRINTRIFISLNNNNNNKKKKKRKNKKLASKFHIFQAKQQRRKKYHVILVPSTSILHEFDIPSHQKTAFEPRHKERRRRRNSE